MPQAAWNFWSGILHLFFFASLLLRVSARVLNRQTIGDGNDAKWRSAQMFIRRRSNRPGDATAVFRARSVPRQRLLRPVLARKAWNNSAAGDIGR